MTGFRAKAVTIASGESLSDGATVSVRAGASTSPSFGTLVAIVMPPAWTSADLTFQASNDGLDFYDVFNAGGTEVSVAGDADQWIGIEPSDFAGISYLKVRSGTSANPVNQGAARELTLIFRPVV